MVQFKEDKNKIIIVGLAGILFIILQFYLLDYWEQQRLIEDTDLFQKGYDFGLENAVITIYNNTQDCNVTVIFVGNSSKQIIDFSCAVEEIKGFVP